MILRGFLCLSFLSKIFYEVMQIKIYFIYKIFCLTSRKRDWLRKSWAQMKVLLCNLKTVRFRYGRWWKMLILRILFMSLPKHFDRVINGGPTFILAALISYKFFYKEKLLFLKQLMSGLFVTFYQFILIINNRK